MYQDFGVPDFCEGPKLFFVALARRSRTSIHVVLAIGRWMLCIQRMKLIRSQGQRERYGVLPDVLRRTGFGYCDDIASADGPGQRDSRCGAIMCRGNTCKRWITKHAGAGAAKR